jgi:hypothetical protein
MLSIEQLYDDVDNLAGLIHPLWKCGFRYMSDAEAIDLADRIVERLIAGQRRVVVVSETGASPLAEICAKLAAIKGASITFVSAKFPRERMTNIAAVLEQFLDGERFLDGEQSLDGKAAPCRGPRSGKKSDLEGATFLGEGLPRLRQECEDMPTDFFASEPPDVMNLLDSLQDFSGRHSSFQKRINDSFADTQIAQLLAEPFVYLDEYIDSGTTFRNAISMLRCLVSSLDMKTVSYYVKPAAAATHERVLYLQATSADRPSCYDNGAYPYENRVDLIGHLYRISDHECVRTDVATIKARSQSVHEIGCGQSDEDLLQFLAEANNAITADQFHEQLQKHFKEPQVKPFIKCEHVLRHIFYSLEKELGNKDCAEFLFQLFDMYGPAWTPMPVALHFDFWSGFSALPPLYAASAHYQQLKPSYLRIRDTLLCKAADLCLARRQAWLQTIDKQLEERYGHGQNRSIDGKGLGSSVLSR